MKKLILILAIVIMGCEPNHITGLENTHRIVIGESDIEGYKYSDLEDPHMGWVEQANGDTYTYWFEGGTIFIETLGPIEYAYQTIETNEVPVTIEGDTISQQVRVGDRLVFTIVYY